MDILSTVTFAVTFTSGAVSAIIISIVANLLTEPSHRWLVKARNRYASLSLRRAQKRVIELERELQILEYYVERPQQLAILAFHNLLNGAKVVFYIGVTIILVIVSGMMNGIGNGLVSHVLTMVSVVSVVFGVLLFKGISDAAELLSKVHRIEDERRTTEQAVRQLRQKYPMLRSFAVNADSSADLVRNVQT